MEDIVLIGDHSLLREGLARTIEAEADLNVAGQMNSAGEALAEIEDLVPWPPSTSPSPA
jgi:DNA-binding NarL/FixJ family response regulator